jgi:zinc protease
LYRALVDRGVAASVFGALLPTGEPFLYSLSATATDGTPLDAVEAALVGELDRVGAQGVTPQEIDRARTQLRACLIFDRDSITNIAHQIGYFETIGASDLFASIDLRLDAVDADAVGRVAEALFAPDNRTIGRFDPQPL